MWKKVSHRMVKIRFTADNYSDWLAHFSQFGLFWHFLGKKGGFNLSLTIPHCAGPFPRTVYRLCITEKSIGRYVFFSFFVGYKCQYLLGWPYTIY